MKTLSHVKKLVLTSMCAALCVVLPMAFHSVPGGGNIFLPMHIPVLLCGMMCSWPYGLVCGVLGPVISSLLTGMPPAVILPAMAVECAVYGCVSGLMLRFVRTRLPVLDLYISLVTAMVLGRVASGLVKAYIFTPGLHPFAWAAPELLKVAIPGICIQLVLLPLLVTMLTKAKLLPSRY